MCAATYLTDSPARGSGRPGRDARAPACPSLLGSTAGVVPDRTLADLHLDDVIATMAPGEFQAAAWRSPAADVGVVEYRQDIVDDLMDPGIRRAAVAFETSVAAARRSIGARNGAHYPVPADLDLLEAVARFTGAVERFADALAASSPRSAGLRGVAAHLWAYVRGAGFRTLADGAATLAAELRQPAVELGVQSGTVWVDEDGGREAWPGRVAAFFERFAGGPDVATAIPARPPRRLNHVEAQAIGLVAGLRPEPFARLHRFAAEHADFLHPGLERLGEELRFFLGFLAVADRLAGVAWCRPRVSAAPDRVTVDGVVDLALALRARPGDPALVPNDLALAATERIAFVTGPNQGGKTTFARAVGQLCHLASLGLPVPARAAAVPLIAPVLTHFPQPDDPENGRGGLAEELARLREVLDAANGSALLVLNELFSSTSAEDALELSGLLLPRFDTLGCRVLWVTFLEELVTSVDGAASLVGQVAADDPSRPTFRFRTQPPNGRSHASALAARHGLSAPDLARRLA